MPTREVARRLALLPQSPIAPDGLLVRDLVGRGRHPHQRWFRQWSPDDERVVDAALRMTDTWDLRDRALDQLSGGQRQRAWIAMTLAQDTDLVLLDEPTTYLDLAHQVEVLDLVTRLNRERGRTVVDGAPRPQPGRALQRPHRGDEGRRGRHPGLAPRGVHRRRCSRTSSASSADVLDDPRTGLPIVVPVSAGVVRRSGAGTFVAGSPSTAAASCGTYRSRT